VIDDDRSKRVQKLGPRWLVERPSSRRLVERDHRVEIQQPDDSLAGSQVGDDVANLNGVPITGAPALPQSKPRTWIARRGVTPTSTEPTPGRARKVVVSRLLIGALVHPFPSP
jgi:hypothetical protein